MTSRGKDCSLKSNQDDSLPHVSGTQQRTGASILEDELYEIVYVIKWPRVPEMREFEAAARTRQHSWAFWFGRTNGYISSYKADGYITS